MTRFQPSRWSSVFVLSVVMIAILAFSGCETLKNTNLGDIYQQSTANAGLDEATVAAGLKEALQVGTAHAVAQTSTVDGFWGNELIRIGIPEVMDPMVNTLRKVGFGSKVDEMELSMNRAAEKSAGQVKDIFWNAITAMSVTDAFTILRGGDSAATEYFRNMTEHELRERIAPIVHDEVVDVGLARLYGKVMDHYTSIPLTDKPDMVDLDTFVTNKTLDGLFKVLADEELKIRQDPVARTTDLLRLVFNEAVRP
jgi:hypothetical protein